MITFGERMRPHAPVELLRDLAQMLADELLDVALEARLRPPALVVLARDLVGPVGDLLEPPARQAESSPALAADDRDDRSFSAADERHERRQVELAADADPVRHRLG